MWNKLNIYGCTQIVQVYHVIRLSDQMYTIIYFHDAREVISIINLGSEDLKAGISYKRFCCSVYFHISTLTCFLKKSQNIHAIVVFSIQPEDTSHVSLLQLQYP